MVVDYVSLVTHLQEYVKADGPLIQLVSVLCWIVGALFGLSALGQLKEVGDGQRHGYTAPITTFIAAVMMISLPELIASVLASAYGGGEGKSPLSYVADAEGSNKTLMAVLSLVSFIGYIFFIRGIVILKESGEPQRYGHSTRGKAAIVMLSGMAAIYIDQTLKMLGNTFGMNFSQYLN